MNICVLSAASSIHTVRWVNAMAERGHTVHLITMHKPDAHIIDKRVVVHTLAFPAPFGYYLNVFSVRKLLRDIKPHLLHTHYASGYGTLSRLVGYEPTLLSVWGSDVYLFPYRSKRSEQTLRKNLRAARRVTATGHALREQTLEFFDHKQADDIDVLPFGIDLDRFLPLSSPAEKDTITIGTVKGLKHVYGIDLFLRAVAGVRARLRELDDPSFMEKLRVKIVGGGPELDSLLALAGELGISDITQFVGAVPNKEVPIYLNKLDVYCALSRSESFGVAVLEASACQVPVIVSDVGGLPEVVEDGVTGFIVHGADEAELVAHATERLFELITSPDLRGEFGRAGRKFVREHYDWQQNVSQMETIYSQFE